MDGVLKNVTNTSSLAFGKKGEELMKVESEAVRVESGSANQEQGLEGSSPRAGDWEEEEEPFVNFNRLYDIENSGEVFERPVHELELPLNTELGKSEEVLAQQLLQPASAKQMTPPKSVESVASIRLVQK